MKTVSLTQGKVALVSDADYWLVRQINWFAMRGKAGIWYAATSGEGGKTLSMHRLLAGFPPFNLDHRNGDGLDNRRSNLRPATRRQNSANQKLRKDNTSGLKGVSALGKKWVAQLRVPGKSGHLGVFLTPQEAHVAYMAAARRHFGEFARAA